MPAQTCLLARRLRGTAPDTPDTPAVCAAGHRLRAELCALAWHQRPLPHARPGRGDGVEAPPLLCDPHVQAPTDSLGDLHPRVCQRDRPRVHPYRALRLRARPEHRRGGRARCRLPGPVCAELRRGESGAGAHPTSPYGHPVNRAVQAAITAGAAGGHGVVPLRRGAGGRTEAKRAAAASACMAGLLCESETDPPAGCWQPGNNVHESVRHTLLGSAE